MRPGALFALALFLVLRTSADATNLLAAPIPWRIEVVDIHGAPVDAERLRDHATLVTFSTRDTQARSIRLGQEAGSRFGGRPGYLSLTVANTSQLSFFLRPLAAGAVAAAEKEAVETALSRQHARGQRAVTEQDVRKHVIFVHDTDGRVWRALGVAPEAGALHVGVIDPAARLVYLARDPIDEAELFAVLEAELAKLDRRD
jgi:hypothetical protein